MRRSERYTGGVVQCGIKNGYFDINGGGTTENIRKYLSEGALIPNWPIGL